MVGIFQKFFIISGSFPGFSLDHILSTSHFGAIRRTDIIAMGYCFLPVFSNTSTFRAFSCSQWTQCGDAFRISDLNRLENETLPTYFRHRRFQSLVRQLNFYNFRKVNRERNFWVYKHPLFHRDKPEDLHLLRRRTCPGVDGRKVRPEVDNSDTDGFRSPRSVSLADGTSDSDGNSSLKSEFSKKRKHAKKRKSAEVSLSSSSGDDEALQLTKNLAAEPMVVKSSEDDPNVNKKKRLESIHNEFRYMQPSRLSSPAIKSCQADLQEQSELVNKVAKQLEEHAKRAALSTGKFIKKRSGTVTPPYVSDTMKYHALTYDDEVEIFDSARGCVVERSYAKVDSQSFTNSVSDDDSENNATSATVVSFNLSEVEAPLRKHVVTAPIEDGNIIATVVRKLIHSSSKEINSDLTIAIAEFCMRTDPHDPTLGEKAIQLMSNHAELAHEFCRYQIALSPNNNQSELMKEVFRGKSEENIRGFKTFVLNCLNDLVIQSKNAAWNETDDLTKCYNVWFSGVSACA